MQRGDATYVVDSEGTFAFGNERGRMHISVKVAGDDLDGTVELAQDRVRYRTAVIIKDGVEYVRPSGEGWTRQPTNIDAVANPFGSQTGPTSWFGLENVGTVRRKGELQHHLRIPDVNWRELSSTFVDENAGGMEIRELTFDVWVSPNGIPSLARIAFDGIARAHGVEADMTFAFDYVFSNFGDTIVIEAPQDYDADPGPVS